MTPLTENPMVTIVIEDGEIKSVTTNVSPELKVNIKEPLTTTVDDNISLPYDVTGKSTYGSTVL